MSVTSYQKGEKFLWRVYLNIRNKEDPTIRVQRLLIGFESEKAALAEEKRLYREIADVLAKKSSQGVTWEAVTAQWELAMRSDTNNYRYQLTTIKDHLGRLKLWTATWLKKPACEITKGDAREALTFMLQQGKSRGYQQQLKHTVNVVYGWGIEHKLIRGVVESPMRGLQIGGPKDEKVPEVLNLEEIRKLLSEAKRRKHEWYPAWAMALLTGMRNGELHALLWSDVDLQNRRITVSKSYHSKRQVVKSTKSGHWRTVPISDELNTLLQELKATSGERQHVLERFWQWDRGLQAQVLRQFCSEIGITSVRFHALRACFATQLLGLDVAPSRVMKICGWKDLKTMQHYTRLAGIDERGATQMLKVLPPDDELAGQVVNLFEFKSRQDK